MAIHKQTVGKMEYSFTTDVYPSHSAGKGSVCFNEQGHVFVNQDGKSDWIHHEMNIGGMSHLGLDDDYVTRAGLSEGTWYIEEGITAVTESYMSQISSSDLYYSTNRVAGLYETNWNVSFVTQPESDEKFLSIVNWREGTGEISASLYGDGQAETKIYQTGAGAKNVMHTGLIPSFQEDRLAPLFALKLDGNGTGVSIGQGQFTWRVNLADPFFNLLDEQFEDDTTGYIPISGTIGNWHFANDTYNKLIISSSTAYSGSNSLYVASSSALFPGAPVYSNLQTGSSDPAVVGDEWSYAWTEFDVPDVDTDCIFIQYRAKVAGSVVTDEGVTYLAPASEAKPSASLEYSSSYQLITRITGDGNTWMKYQYQLKDSAHNLRGTRQRLIFAWYTNGNQFLSQEPIAYDDIQVYFKRK